MPANTARVYEQAALAALPAPGWEQVFTRRNSLTLQIGDPNFGEYYINSEIYVRYIVKYQQLSQQTITKYFQLSQNKNATLFK